MSDKPKGPTNAQIDWAAKLLPFYELDIIPKEKILDILGYDDLIKNDSS